MVEKNLKCDPSKGQLILSHAHAEHAHLVIGLKSVASAPRIRESKQFCSHIP